MWAPRGGEEANAGAGGGRAGRPRGGRARTPRTADGRAAAVGRCVVGRQERVRREGVASAVDAALSPRPLFAPFSVRKRARRTLASEPRRPGKMLRCLERRVSSRGEAVKEKEEMTSALRTNLCGVL